MLLALGGEYRAERDTLGGCVMESAPVHRVPVQPQVLGTENLHVHNVDRAILVQVAIIVNVGLILGPGNRKRCPEQRRKRDHQNRFEK